MKDLLKAVCQTGAGSLVIMLSTVVTGKLIAIVLGPHGIGLFAVVQQVNLAIIGFATFGGGNALIQGIASRDGIARSRYIATTLLLFVAAASLASVALVASAPVIAPLITGRDSTITVGMIRWIALPVSLGAFFGYLAGVLNGFRAIGRLAAVKIAGAITLALLAYPACLLVDGGYPVAFIWLISASLLVQALLSFLSAHRHGWLQMTGEEGSSIYSGEMARHFLSVAGVLFFTAQLGSGAVLAISSLILRTEGLAIVGVFNAAWSLSMNYVLLILTCFSTYYLPTLSGARNQQEGAVVMGNVFRLTMLALVPLLTALIVLKPLVITMLYSGEFSGALPILRWMLIANYLRVFAWVFATPAIARADMKVYFWTESLWSLGLIVLSTLFVLGFRLIEGVGIALIILYIGYLAYYVWYAGNRHGFKVSKQDRVMWLLGLAIVVGVSVHSWNSTTVEWVSALPWILIGVGFSWFVLRGEERQKIVLMLKARLGEVA